MEQLRPLLLKLQKSIDRLALVVFLLLTAALLFLWQAERGATRPEPGEVTPTPMEAYFPNEAHDQVVQYLAWQGDIFADRPLDENHPFNANLRYNILARRELASEQEIAAQAGEALRRAEATWTEAGDTDLPELRRIELLQQTIDDAERIVTVWAAHGAEQLPRAREILTAAQEMLDTLTPQEEEGETPAPL